MSQTEDPSDQQLPPILVDPVMADEADVPLLQDPADSPRPAFTEEQLASVQAELTSLTRDLTDRLLDGAMRAHVSAVRIAFHALLSPETI